MGGKVQEGEEQEQVVYIERSERGVKMAGKRPFPLLVALKIQCKGFISWRR